MKVFWMAVALMVAAASAWAYSPVPVQKSAAELEVKAALDNAASDSAKLRIAEEALDKYPDNVPAGRLAQDVIVKLKTNPQAFFKARAAKSESIAAHYLHGWLAGDTVVTDQEANWILKKDPKSFWGHMLAADAVWNHENVDYVLLRREIESAIAADPSRPEGYLYMGYVLEEQDKWAEAREAFEAGAVADPTNTAIRDQRLTAYAELRDANAFFGLNKGLYREKPLEMNLPRANKPGNVTTADLLGKYTVVEYWAYT